MLAGGGPIGLVAGAAAPRRPPQPARARRGAARDGTVARCVASTGDARPGGAVWVEPSSASHFALAAFCVSRRARDGARVARGGGWRRALEPAALVVAFPQGRPLHRGRRRPSSQRVLAGLARRRGGAPSSRPPRGASSVLRGELGPARRNPVDGVRSRAGLSRRSRSHVRPAERRVGARVPALRRLARRRRRRSS